MVVNVVLRCCPGHAALKEAALSRCRIGARRYSVSLPVPPTMVMLEALPEAGNRCRCHAEHGDRGAAALAREGWCSARAAGQDAAECRGVFRRWSMPGRIAARGRRPG